MFFMWLLLLAEVVILQVRPMQHPTSNHHRNEDEFHVHRSLDWRVEAISMKNTIHFDNRARSLCYRVDIPLRLMSIRISNTSFSTRFM